jgi:hypothetical protein
MFPFYARACAAQRAHRVPSRFLSRAPLIPPHRVAAAAEVAMTLDTASPPALKAHADAALLLLALRGREHVERRPFSALLGAAGGVEERRALAARLAAAGLFTSSRRRSVPAAGTRETADTLAGLVAELLELRIAFCALLPTRLVPSKRLPPTSAESRVASGASVAGERKGEATSVSVGDGGLCSLLRIAGHPEGTHDALITSLRAEAEDAARCVAVLSGSARLPTLVTTLLSSARRAASVTSQRAVRGARGDLRSTALALVRALESPAGTWAPPAEGPPYALPLIAAYLGDFRLARQATIAIAASAPPNAPATAAAAILAAVRSPADPLYSTAAYGIGTAAAVSDVVRERRLRSPIAPILRRLAGKVTVPPVPERAAGSESALLTAAHSTPIWDPLAWLRAPAAAGLSPAATSALIPDTIARPIAGAVATSLTAKAAAAYAAAVRAAAAELTRSLPPLTARRAVAANAVGSTGQVTNARTLLAFISPYVRGSPRAREALRTAVSRVAADVETSVSRGYSRDSALRTALAPDSPSRKYLLALMTTLPPTSHACLYTPLVSGLPYVKIEDVGAVFSNEPGVVEKGAADDSEGRPAAGAVGAADADVVEGRDVPSSTARTLDAVGASSGGGGAAAVDEGAVSAQHAPPLARDVAAAAAEGAPAPARDVLVATAAAEGAPATARALDDALAAAFARVERLVQLPPATDALVSSLASLSGGGAPDPRARALAFALRLAHLFPPAPFERLRETVGELAGMVSRAHAADGRAGAASPDGFFAEWPPGRFFPAGPRSRAGGVAAAAHGGRWQLALLRASSAMAPLSHVLDDAFAFAVTHGWLTPPVLDFARAVLTHPAGVHFVRGEADGAVDGAVDGASGLRLTRGGPGADGTAPAALAFSDDTAARDVPSAVAPHIAGAVSAPRPAAGGPPAASRFDVAVPSLSVLFDAAATPPPAAAAPAPAPPPLAADLRLSLSAALRPGTPAARAARALPDVVAGAAPAPREGSLAAAAAAALAAPDHTRMVMAACVRLTATAGDALAAAPPPAAAAGAPPWVPSPDEAARSILLTNLPLVGVRTAAWWEARGVAPGAPGYLAERAQLAEADVRAMVAHLGAVERVVLFADAVPAAERAFWGGDVAAYRGWRLGGQKRALVGAAGDRRKRAARAAAPSAARPPPRSPFASVFKVQVGGARAFATVAGGAREGAKGGGGARRGAKGGGGAKAGAADAAGAAVAAPPPPPPPSNLTALLSAQGSAARTGRRSIAHRLRRFNAASPLRAVVTFADAAAAERATAPALTLFGLVFGDVACGVSPAAANETVLLRGLPPGLRHAAVAALLGDALAHAGVRVTPHGGGGGVAGPLWSRDPLDIAPDAAALVTNAAGEALVRCASFGDALALIERLRGLRVGRRVSASAGRQGRSGLWAGGEVTATLASPADLRRALVERSVLRTDDNAAEQSE